VRDLLQIDDSCTVLFTVNDTVLPIRIATCFVQTAWILGRPSIRRFRKTTAFLSPCNCLPPR
jgi:hypothetical protein